MLLCHFPLGNSLDASFAFIELLNSVQVNHLLDECQVHGSEEGFDSNMLALHALLWM